MELPLGEFMPVVGVVDVKLPVFPDIISDFGACSTCRLSKDEIIHFQNAYRAFAKYVANGHPLPARNRSLSIVYTDRSELTIITDGAYGQTTNFIVFRMDQLRKAAKEKGRSFPIILVALEELAHALYFILDEWEVKEKVSEILAFNGNPIEIGQEYPYRFFPDGQRRYDFYQPPQAVGKTRSEESHS